MIDKMAYHNTACSSVPAGTAPTRGQHTTPVQCNEERLRNGFPPAAVTGITALLAQLETQPTLPSIALSIVADVSGYKRTMTCCNGVWDGYDLTHPFQDDRSTVVYGTSTHTTFEQEATLRMSPSAPIPHPLPPAHLVIQPQVQVPPHAPSQPQ